MGIEVVIGYLVVGIVETVTDPTRKTFAKVDIGLAGEITKSVEIGESITPIHV